MVCDIQEQSSARARVTPAGRAVGKLNIAAQERTKGAIALGADGPCQHTAGVAKANTAESKGSGGRASRKVLVGLGLCFRRGSSLRASTTSPLDQAQEAEAWESDVFYFR